MNHSNRNQNHFKRYRNNLQRLETLTSQSFTRLSAVQGDNSSIKDYSNLNREDEIHKLANIMNVKVIEVRKLLDKQRQKLTDGSEKKSYIDWLLSEDASAAAAPASPSLPKRMTSSTAIDDTTTKKSRNDMPTRPRPIRETSASMKSISNDSASEDVQMGESTFSTADLSLLSSCKFDEVADIHPNLRKSLKNNLKVDYMTDIQAKTFPIAITGRDILGRARTGTGKTLAFL